jgi:cardiolipin synthase
MFTVPNLVSGLRLLAVPYFWYVLVGERRVVAAAVMIFIIGSTDWVDGYLARRLNQVSEVGKFLDPLADRLMIASALIGGLITGILPAVIGWPLLIREAAVGTGALVLAGRGGGKLEVRPLGKVATFLLYGAIPAFYLAATGVIPWLFAPPAWVGGVVGLLLYWYVAFQYFRDLSGRAGR